MDEMINFKPDGGSGGSGASDGSRRQEPRRVKEKTIDWADRRMDQGKPVGARWSETGRESMEDSCC